MLSFLYPITAMNTSRFTIHHIGMPTAQFIVEAGAVQGGHDQVAGDEVKGFFRRAEGEDRGRPAPGGGTSWMVAAESRKPNDVWRVKALPTPWRGAARPR